MPLSWNEIRLRASTFVNEWKDSQSVKEKAEAQTFETEFLKIFGVDRKKVALFEHEIHYENSNDKGYIDCIWKGYIIIEMKTPGKDLDKAYDQAKAYALSLPQKEIPRGILTCDFLNFQYYDLEKNAECYSFPLEELPNRIDLFGHLAGYKDVSYQAVSPVDIQAAELMGELHDALKENGYTGHALEMYLVRLLFCLFADNTRIFGENKVFHKYIMNNTKEDGTDLALHLGFIFDILNQHEDNRQKNLDEALQKFRYINGGLFEERLQTASFNSKMHKTLLKCCTFDWGKIKPEIFGAMFQSVKDKEKRRELGEHYTSETNILKVIKPLFLDELQAEFEKIKKLTSAVRKHRLLEFHDKLRSLKFLDPACGCGNFLVVSYRELRLLETEVIAEWLEGQRITDIELMVRVNVDQFYGIEIEEFPARIAQTALWLMDHLMNNVASDRFGEYFARFPLTASPTIVIGNALTTDWETIIPKDELKYILGNPPFLGYKMQSESQKKDLELVFQDSVSAKSLDLVTAWYIKAANYIQDTTIQVAFVSTNSICQGEHVLILWNSLLNKYRIKINFAHQTFKWSNEARGMAAVFVVIIGFSLFDTKKTLYIYDDIKGEPQEYNPKMINPYLIEAETVFIQKRSNPLCDVPKMQKGNEMYDDLNLIIEADEYDDFIKNEPLSKKYIKQYMGSDEFINNKKRYCIWLVNVDPAEIRKMPSVMKRVEAVKKFRLASKREATRKTAATPTTFSVIHQPDTNYILFPVISSERRTYIPIGFLPPEVIVSYAVFTIPNATLYHFGILTSIMHMTWTRYICGRLKSDFRYSNDIIYNNFPFPSPTDKQKTAIEEAAQGVLDQRAKFPNASLADLYDPLAMPPALLKAHQKLDKAVEAAYGKTFQTDSERVAYLFEQYQKLCGELFTDTKKTGKGKKIK